MIEIIFLMVLGFIWILSASIQDLRTRIVSDWLSFSLIIFAIGFRFFYSLFGGDFNFFYQGLFGLGIFFILGNLLYYGKMFAGGDAKLMIAIGAILPLSADFFSNFENYLSFFIIFLFSGAIYGMTWSIFLPLRRFGDYKREFRNQFDKNRKLFFSVMAFGILLILSGFFQPLFFFFGILIFVFPYLYVHAKAVDESCLIKEIKTKNLVDGDWLQNDLKIGSKIIKARWEGLNKQNIKFIQKHRKEINVRYGIPFVPVFFFSFAIFVYFYLSGMDIFSLF